ncbi:MAG: GNAT family N-acetyltransferase [Sutterellaceae bacterium]|nr:GNAT family N-acetyltransferase [Burkholderiaceae bacterium]MCX7902412.1 GNAT family N-acetyltransferase [Burkholderiaceae bacterium]MDW8431033.1 GNAT family N-acetyltransferase [Sutterellaceae bacterium]
MGSADVRIELGDWPRLRAEAEQIRFEVFVREQKVPAEIEIDADDPRSLHALARDAGGRAVGTGRLLPDGRIGRMAVRAEARGHGVGSAILQALIEAARQRGVREVVLHAQQHAVAFYTRHGFVAEGEPFEEAGIAHQLMRRRL